MTNADTKIAEQVNVATPVDDFQSKLAELKADFDRAFATLADKRLARDEVELAFKRAQADVRKARDILDAAGDAIRHFCVDHASRINRDFIESDLDTFVNARINIAAQDGNSCTNPALSEIYVSWFDDHFNIYGVWDIFAQYDTPAQVESAINLLKAAIKRGDSEFKFPSVDELNPTPNPDKPKYKPQCHGDNPHDFSTPGNLNFDPNDRLRSYQKSVPDRLIDAMRFNLLKIQQYCRSSNINAAINELGCYNICNDA